MANVLTYKGSGVVQIMSTTELEALSQAVLENMALNDGPGGIYTSNVGNASFTLIGTFTDTRYAGNIGDGNVTILSSEYNLYQDLTTPTGTDSPRAITYTDASTPMGEATDTELNEIADAVLTYCVNSEGPHSFVLQSSAPVDGGTWTNLGQLKDVYSGGIETPKYLYKKLTSGVYDLKRPLKYSGSGILQEFSNTEIQQIAKRVRQRIVDTGVGKYQFQSSAPTPGTWVSKGSIIDTRATEVPDVTYTSDAYNTVYTANDTSYSIGNYYLGDTDIPYQLDITNYLGPVDVTYTQDTATFYTNVYTGTGQLGYTAPLFVSFSGTTPANFTGTTPVYYAGSYTGVVQQSYTGTTPATFESNYSLDFYTGAVQYTRDTLFGLGYTRTTMVVQYNVTDNYTMIFDPTSFSASYLHDTTFYTRYFAFYERDAGLYTATFIQPSYFDLEYHGIIYTLGYLTTYALTVTAIGGYISGEIVYSGAGATTYTDLGTGYTSDFYTREYFTVFTATNYTLSSYFTSNITFTGPSIIYAGTFTGLTTAYFSGPGGAAYFGAVNYTGVTPATYTGITPTTYTGLGNAFYTGPGGTAYFGAIVYTGVTNAFYVGTVANGAYYVGLISSPLYTGARPAVNYTSGETIYTGEGTAYGIDYVGLYTGSSISDTLVTISTITLWRRVA